MKRVDRTNGEKLEKTSKKKTGKDLQFGYYNSGCLYLGGRDWALKITTLTSEACWGKKLGGDK